MRRYFVSVGVAALCGSLLWACGAGDRKFVDEETEMEAPDAGDSNGEGDGDSGTPDAGYTLPENGLFGIVYPKTGLTQEQCKPEQSRLVVNETTGEQEARYFTGLYTPAQIERLKQMVLSPNSPHLSELPFLPSELEDSPWNHIDKYTMPAAGTVCGLKIVDATNPEAPVYQLDTYENKAAAEADGARVTHLGNCGHCSELSNLAILLSLPDRTYRMRDCALKGIGAEGKMGVLNCINEFGLTNNCTMAWYYNSVYTQDVCISDCFAYAEANYHTADGALNPCMICNAENADELFKVIVSRRDDAQPYSMCRELPEEEWICHNYMDDFDNPEGCIGIGAPKQRWTCTTEDYDESINNYDLAKCVELVE